MVWFFLVLLTGWAIYQGSELRSLSQRVELLRDRLEQESRRRAEPRSAAPEPASDTVEAAPDAPAAPPAPEQVLAPEPILAPAARQDDAAFAPPPRPAQPHRPPINVAAWLSEHGLAWLGGGALVLGGIFLVAYAARRGFFTPPLRIAAAVILGAVLLALGEGLRRQERLQARRGAQLAAIATGAGAAILYAAVWASERLYHFIGLEISAVLLAAISGGLLALAWRHGAPLAILALGGACLTPLITGRGDWSPWALGGYLALIGVTGYGAAALRRWPQVGLLVGAGLLMWTLSMGAETETPPRLLLTLLTPALALVVLAWRRHEGDLDPPQAAPGAWLFPAALAGAVVATLDQIAHLGGSAPVLSGLAPAGLAGLTAIALIRRHATAPLQLLPQLRLLAALVMSGASAASADLGFVGLGLGAIAALLGLCAAYSATDARQSLWSASSALVSVMILAAADLLMRKAGLAHAGVGAALGAAGLSLGVLVLAKRSPDPRSDLGVAIWTWAAGALAALAIGWAAPDEARPAGLGALAVVLVLLQGRLAWRGLSAAALAAGVATLGALLHPDLIAKVFQGGSALLPLALAGVGATALLTLAARLTPRHNRDPAEVMSSLAITAALAGAFLLLANLIARKDGHGVDPFLGAGLRGLLLFAAGLAARPGVQAGPIAQWRPHVLNGLGALHLLVAPLLVLNPLWSDIPVAGPPVLDALALAVLAPALFLAAASRRPGAVRPWLPSAYAMAALVAGLAWAFLEVRRLAQGPDFARALDPLSRVEAAADGLILILAACGFLVFTARRRLSERARADALLALALALALADLAFFHLASPWWGPVNRPLSGYGAAAVLGALNLGGIAGALWLARLADAHQALARLTRASAALQLFVLTTLAVRLGFRGLDMATARSEARIETWSFSFVWAVFGVGVMVLGLRQGRPELRWTGLGLLLFTTAKVLLFDMARLDGVVRAASFLALGALLLLGALAARRFAGAREAQETPEA